MNNLHKRDECDVTHWSVIIMWTLWHGVSHTTTHCETQLVVIKASYNTVNDTPLCHRLWRHTTLSSTTATHPRHPAASEVQWGRPVYPTLYVKHLGSRHDVLRHLPVCYIAALPCQGRQVLTSLKKKISIILGLKLQRYKYNCTLLYSLIIYTT